MHMYTKHFLDLLPLASQGASKAIKAFHLIQFYVLLISLNTQGKPKPLVPSY